MWQKYFKELITTIQCNTAISSVKFFILLLDHAGNDKILVKSQKKSTFVLRAKIAINYTFILFC